MLSWFARLRFIQEREKAVGKGTIKGTIKSTTVSNSGMLNAGRKRKPKKEAKTNRQGGKGTKKRKKQNTKRKN